MINVAFKRSTLINKCFLCNRARNVMRVSLTNVAGDEVKTIDLCDTCQTELGETFHHVSHVNIPIDNR